MDDDEDFQRHMAAARADYYNRRPIRDNSGMLTLYLHSYTYRVQIQGKCTVGNERQHAKGGFSWAEATSFGYERNTD